MLTGTGTHTHVHTHTRAHTDTPLSAPCAPCAPCTLAHWYKVSWHTDIHVRCVWRTCVCVYVWHVPDVYACTCVRCIPMCDVCTCTCVCVYMCMCICTCVWYRWMCARWMYVCTWVRVLLLVVVSMCYSYEHRLRHRAHRPPWTQPT